MKRLVAFLIFGLISATCSPHALAQMASPPLSRADRALVHRCLDMYGPYEGGDEAEIAAEEAAKPRAKRLFDRMPKSEIERRLVPIRKSLYRGTRAYASVAYVLAYYGIDFDFNAGRVVEAISLAYRPPAKLRAAGFKLNVHDENQRDYAGEVEAGGAVNALYRRHHSDSLLRAYLRAPGDGEVGEDQWSEIGELFMLFPHHVLRAMQSQHDIAILASDIYEGAGDWKEVHGVTHGDFSKVWRVIHRLERSRDARTASLARRLDSAFQPPKD